MNIDGRLLYFVGIPEFQSCIMILWEFDLGNGWSWNWHGWGLCSIIIPFDLVVPDLLLNIIPHSFFLATRRIFKTSTSKSCLQSLLVATVSVVLRGTTRWNSGEQDISYYHGTCEEVRRDWNIHSSFAISIIIPIICSLLVFTMERGNAQTGLGQPGSDWSWFEPNIIHFTEVENNRSESLAIILTTLVKSR